MIKLPTISYKFIMIRIEPREQIRNNYTQQALKEKNLFMLLNLIRNFMPISRADLAKRTGLSPTTVSVLVDELIKNGWVRETGTDTSADRGRKPILLELNAMRGAVVTVEILGGGFICSLYDICLNKLGKTRIYKEAYTDEDIDNEIYDLLNHKNISMADLLTIHIIFPGVFNQSTGELLHSAVLDNEYMVNVNKTLVEYIQKRFDKSDVMISNYSSIIAFAEHLEHLDHLPVRLLSITIDEGIGGAIVTSDDNGNISKCLSIEIGHIIVDQHGPQCKCKNRGCLEAFCSTPALFRAVNEKTGMQLNFSEYFGSECNETAMQLLAERFREGDPLVTEVINEYIYTLCCALCNIVNLYGIQSIRIGGMISILGQRFIEMVRDTLNSKFIFFNNDRPIDVNFTEGDFERMRVAAVIIALNKTFKYS